jgi:hypothetical protein
MGARFLYHPITFDLIIVPVFIPIHSSHLLSLFTLEGGSFDLRLSIHALIAYPIYRRHPNYGPTIRLPCPIAAANPFTDSQSNRETNSAVCVGNILNFPPNFKAAKSSTEYICTEQHIKSHVWEEIPILSRN